MDRSSIKWIILAVLIVVAAFAVTRLMPSRTPAPADYYTARNTPVLVSPERDFLDDGAVADLAPVLTTSNGVINDGGLVIGSLAGTLRVSGEGFSSGQRYPLMSTCYRSNFSPGLSWSDAPSKTKSFAVLFEKVEATGDPVLYWSVYNIADDSTGLAANLPKDIAEIKDVGYQGKNNAGNIGYTGPCIPRGEHAFQIRVIALDTILKIAAGVDRTELFKAMNGHVIDMVKMPVMHLYKN